MQSTTIPTPASPDLCTFKVLIEGTEMPGTVQVVSIAVTRELNRIPTATLYIQDGEAAETTFKQSNTDLFVPGKKVDIQLGYRSTEDVVFKGIIVKHSIKIRRTGSFLIVECRDEAAKMTNGTKTAYFEDKKDSDILEDIIAKHGLQKDVEATSTQLQSVVQYNATDWDFMVMRAEANGQFVMVEDGKIIIAKPDTSASAVVTTTYGATILELDAEMDARIQTKGIKAQAWNPADQEIVEAEATEPATTSNGNIDAAQLADVLGGDARLLRHTGPMDTTELQAWADAQLQRERLAKVRGRVKFQGFAGVKPGNTIEVQGIGERMEGKVYVSAVRHMLANGNWETDAQFGVSPETFGERHQLQPMPAAGLLPSIAGLHIGVVTKLGDDPSGEGRIKVRIPVINPQEEGTWARIATLDAGKDRGTFFYPEIDDEVIVGFLNDDPRFPVVLGMCHSSNKPAPEPPTDDNHRKGYVSREKMKMNFDDEKKIITFETPAGNKFILSEEDKAITLEDQNGNKIVLDSAGITIESSKDFIVKAQKDIKLDGVNVEAKASASLKATASASAELSGATTEVKGSGTTTIKGGLVQIN